MAMPPASVKSKRGYASLPLSAQIVSGLALALLVLVVGVAAVFALAATLTQNRLAIPIDGVPISIWKLNSVQNRWLTLRTKVEKAEAAVATADAKRFELQDNAQRAANEIVTAKNALESYVWQISLLASAYDTALADDLGKLTDLDSKVARIIRSVPRFADIPALKDVPDKLIPLSIHLSKARTELQIVESAQRSQDQELVSATAKVIQAKDELLKVLREIKETLDDPTRARVENAFHELNPGDDLKGSLWRKLVLLQTDVLTLTLVVLMGVLGSSLQIAHSFFRARTISSPGEYGLRLGFGAVTALAIFVVGKAGIPVIADASKFGGDAPINPYFISFIAIISGLLSERAIVAVQEQGKRIFTGGELGVVRYARFDLTELVKLQGASIEQLAGYLSATPDQTRALLAGSAPVSAEQQLIVSILLRREVRDIFSDIQPRQASAQNGPPAPGT